MSGLGGGVIAGALLRAIAAAAPVSPEDFQTTLLAEFGDCAVRDSRGAAAAVVLADRWWQKGGRVAQLMAGRCGAKLRANGVRVIFDEPLAALAHALVRAEFAAAGPAELADRALLPHLPRPDPARRRNGDVYASWRADYSRLGECVARAEPVRTRLWLVQEADSAETLASKGVLASAVADCGRRLGLAGIHRDLSRDKLALSYYRLAHAAVTPSKVDR